MSSFRRLRARFDEAGASEDTLACYLNIEDRFLDRAVNISASSKVSSEIESMFMIKLTSMKLTETSMMLLIDSSLKILKDSAEM